MHQRLEQIINAFGMANIRTELELIKLADELQFKLTDTGDYRLEDDPHFIQFDEKIRSASYEMSKQYQIFFCLENSIRQMIHERLSEKASEEHQDSNWFREEYVKEETIKNAKKRKSLEASRGITERSDRLIDYTDFSELADIFEKNWDDVFSDMFADMKGLKRILRDLNSSRASIAHSVALSKTEIDRLRISLTDWFNITS